MSIYGDLSKAQRILLTALYGEIPVKRAVSIDTALTVTRKQVQTATNLFEMGFIRMDDVKGWSYSRKIWLTALAVDEMSRVSRERKTARYANRHLG